MAKKTLKAKDIEALENTNPIVPLSFPGTATIPTLDGCTTLTGACQGPTLDCLVVTGDGCVQISGAYACQFTNGCWTFTGACTTITGAGCSVE